MLYSKRAFVHVWCYYGKQALRFYGSKAVTVSGIMIQNSARTHLKFDNCIGVQVFDIRDDCISIQTGCSNIYMHNINCGPGHGISLGALGAGKTKACFSNIIVRDITLHNTLTGVRIKTWQGGDGSVQGITFSNIQVYEVEIPIMIDQFYCASDKSKCPYGTLRTRTVPPIDCLMPSKLSSTRVQSYGNSCWV
ncbi:polygalacturonase [Quercus suber]|uniref:Polygalacturonase n=1 Tax=Quercus suber TaxID=58331 RepID=A0AAW0IVB4_QUESU